MNLDPFFTVNSYYGRNILQVFTKKAGDNSNSVPILKYEP